MGRQILVLLWIHSLGPICLYFRAVAFGSASKLHTSLSSERNKKRDCWQRQWGAIRFVSPETSLILSRDWHAAWSVDRRDKRTGHACWQGNQFVLPLYSALYLSALHSKLSDRFLKSKTMVRKTMRTAHCRVTLDKPCQETDLQNDFW